MYNDIHGMDGRGWGIGDGLPMVSRVEIFLSSRRMSVHNEIQPVETLQMHGFLYKHMGETSKGHNFNGKV